MRQTLLRRQSHASLLQATEFAVGSSSRNAVFASLHALNASVTAVGCVGSMALKRKPATSLSFPDQK